MEENPKEIVRKVLNESLSALNGVAIEDLTFNDVLVTAMEVRDDLIDVAGYKLDDFSMYECAFKYFESRFSSLKQRILYENDVKKFYN